MLGKEELAPSSRCTLFKTVCTVLEFSQTSNNLGQIGWVQANLNVSTTALPPNNITKFPSDYSNSDCESLSITYRLRYTPVIGRPPKVI